MEKKVKWPRVMATFQVTFLYVSSGTTLLSQSARCWKASHNNIIHHCFGNLVMSHFKNSQTKSQFVMGCTIAPSFVLETRLQVKPTRF